MKDIDYRSTIQVILELLVSKAIQEYKQDKISFGKAAEMAGISLWEWIDELRRRNIPINFTIDDARDEIARWREKMSR